ncbi:MAG: aldolase/citrate lyase family protein, partial [Pirellulales bacterium]|nr:aldolase/citrate lyase family protein [Pirellulales bacterium]
VEGGHWMIQQILAHGVHGLHLARARDPEAVRRYIQIARYPIHDQGKDQGLEQGLRGMGSNAFAQKIWGLSKHEYFNKADVWPLNPEGELMLGVKIEDPQALARVEQTLKTPGIGFAESGPRDMGLSYGYLEGRADPPLPPEVIAASQRVLDAAKANDLPFLDNVLPDNVIQRIEWGVSIAAGGSEEAAEIGRRHTGRTMPW